MATQKKTSIEKIQFNKKELLWTNINFPTEKATSYLKRKYKFHDLDLEDCLSENQRPKIDDYDDYLFIVLHIPSTSRGRNKRIKISEVHFFVGHNYLVSLHENDSILNKVFAKVKKSKKLKEEYLSKGPGYLLYMLVDDLFNAGFPILDDLSKQTNEMEKDVFDPDYKSDRLKEILLLKKDIINFRRIIIPQRAIIAQLEHKNKKFIGEDLEIYFDDTVDKIEKIWSNLENLKELVASIQETNESIISHNTNNVIKVLTLLSFIMLPLTFITGFYGMNVEALPFANHPTASFIIATFIFFIALSMFIYFKVKRWF